MKTIFFSGSSAKTSELRNIIPDLFQCPLDIPELQELDTSSIIENKLTYALEYCSKNATPVPLIDSNNVEVLTDPSSLSSHYLIVEDTSLYLEAFDYLLPGPLIKWFMKSIDSQGIYTTCKKYNLWGAKAQTMIGLYDPEINKTLYFVGNLQGTITKPTTNTSFGWDNIFIPSGKQLPFSKFSISEKNKYSMRSFAIKELLNYVQNKEHA